MRWLVAGVAVLVAGVIVWSIGSRLSTDAIGMGVGMIFGVLSGVPLALLILAAPRSGRRQPDHDTRMAWEAQEMYWAERNRSKELVEQAYRKGYLDGNRAAVAGYIEQRGV